MAQWNGAGRSNNKGKGGGGGGGDPVDRELILRKIFIGGVKPDTQDEQFRELFSQFGEIEELVHVRNRETKMSKGFAFITFVSPTAVDKCVSSKPHHLNGKDVDVKRAVPKDQSQDKCTKIFVGGLPETDEAEMKRFFESYGPVTQCQFKRDQTTGRGRGFGFVTFEEWDTVDKLVILKHIEYNGKKIECKKASDAKSDGSGGGQKNQSGGGGNPSVYNQQSAQSSYQPPPNYGPPPGSYPPPHGYPGYPPHYPGYGAPPPAAAPGGAAAAAPPAGYPGYPPAPAYPGYPAAPSYPGYHGYPPSAAPPNYYPQAGQYNQAPSTYGAQKGGYSSHSSSRSANYKPY